MKKKTSKTTAAKPVAKLTAKRGKGYGQLVTAISGVISASISAIVGPYHAPFTVTARYAAAISSHLFTCTSPWPSFHSKPLHFTTGSVTCDAIFGAQ